MNPEHWHQRWQEGRIGFHRDAVHPRLETHWPRLVPETDSHVLVPLCGKSRDLLWLAERGHAVTGVELSPLAVGQFFAENPLPAPRVRREGAFEHHECERLRLCCGDFFRLRPEDLAAPLAIYDRAALVALPASMRGDYADHLARLSPPGTRMLLVSLERPGDSGSGPPFSVATAEIENLFAPGWSLEERETSAPDERGVRETVLFLVRRG